MDEPMKFLRMQVPFYALLLTTKVVWWLSREGRMERGSFGFAQAGWSRIYAD
jgi:hypothetical protein